MRIIGEIAHPTLKITVFKMEHRITLKLETGMYEQAYRFRLTEGLAGFDEVQKMVDEPFLAKVEARFLEMRNDTEQLLGRFMPLEEGDAYDEII